MLALFAYDSDGSGDLPTVAGRKTRGTRAAPSATQADDILLRVGAGGYGATAFGATSRSFIQFEASENWTDAAQGARITFRTTDNTTIVPDERVIIDQDGSVLVGWDTNYGSPLSIDNLTAFSTASLEAGGSNIFLNNTTSGVGAGNFGPSICFGGPGTSRAHTRIVSVQGAADADQVGLAFFTHPSATGGDAIVEAVRITYLGDVGIGSITGPTANSGQVLFFGDNTNDPTMAANTAGFYGNDVGGTVEAFAIDEGGAAAQLTPHNAETGLWIARVRNQDGVWMEVQMELMMKALNEMLGGNYIKEWTEEVH